MLLNKKSEPHPHFLGLFLTELCANFKKKWVKRFSEIPSFARCFDKLLFIQVLIQSEHLIILRETLSF